VRLLGVLSTLTLISRTIHTSLMWDCWECLVHSHLLVVQYRQGWCEIVESAKYTHTYYSYSTHKPDVQLLRVLRTLTLITRTVQTSLMCDCWEWFVHSRLLLVQYTQACCAIVESGSYTHAYYSYNTHKPIMRLLGVFSTLTLVTCIIQTSLMCDCWECLVHPRLLLIQYRQACFTIVEPALHS